MAERKKLSKKLRFEVFKRDSFTCQYCGRSAPDVVLEVDHIIPIAENGTNDITNLITSCFDCNRGKTDKKLTDNQTVKMQKKELDKLQHRKEQLEMMAKWQVELLNIEQQEVNKIIEVINQKRKVNVKLTESGMKTMTSLIKKYSFKIVLESAVLAFEKYDDIHLAFKKISSIAYIKKNDEDNPNLKDLYYIRAIMRNRFSYIVEYEAIQLMEVALGKGASIEELRDLARTTKSWTEWKSIVSNFISEGDE